jgi:hypothetical protein
MRVAIGTIALFCGMALLGEPRGLAAPAQAQATDPCGWIGVAVSPMTSAYAASLGMVQPYGAIFEQPEPGSPAACRHPGGRRDHLGQRQEYRKRCAAPTFRLEAVSVSLRCEFHR